METFPFRFLKGRRNDGKRVEPSRAAQWSQPGSTGVFRMGGGGRLTGRSRVHAKEGTGHREAPPDAGAAARPASSRDGGVPPQIRPEGTTSRPHAPPGARGCDCPQAGLSKMKPESEAEGKVQ